MYLIIHTHRRFHMIVISFTTLSSREKQKGPSFRCVFWNAKNPQRNGFRFFFQCRILLCFRPWPAASLEHLVYFGLLLPKSRSFEMVNVCSYWLILFFIFCSLISIGWVGQRPPPSLFVEFVLARICLRKASSQVPIVSVSGTRPYASWSQTRANKTYSCKLATCN